MFLTEPIISENVKSIILDMLPALKIEKILLIQHSDDSIVADINDDLIVKFPKNQESLEKLVFENRLLGLLKTRIYSLAIPDMKMISGNFPFTIHSKIKGDILLPKQYEKLLENSKNSLALKLTNFFVELHRIPKNDFKHIGAKAIKPYATSKKIKETLKDKFQDNSDAGKIIFDCLEKHDLIKVKEDEIIFGYFDSHGNNMAFDHDKQVLNGIFDFADAGFDDFHKELHCLNWISSDLTQRVCKLYSIKRDHFVDVDRVNLYTLVCRLSDYVNVIENNAPKSVLEACHQNVIEWVNSLYEYEDVKKRTGLMF